jgi:hypothetical protein
VRATWRALPAWPYEQRPPSSSSFRTSWDGSLAKLEQEIARIQGDDVVIGIVCEPSEISFSGALKSGARARLAHPGAEVSFDHPDRGRVVFHTDAYKTLHFNLHAIALGLEALRAVDRHGITSSAEQYAGFAQLTAGGPDPARGKLLAERHGSIAEALKKTHPDHGGDARDLADVQAYRKSIGAAAR